MAERYLANWGRFIDLELASDTGYRGAGHKAGRYDLLLKLPGVMAAMPLNRGESNPCVSIA